MIRLWTKNSTGVAPDGAWLAGDVNDLQDAVAGLEDLTQNLQAASLAIGESGLQLLRYGSGEARLSGKLRTDGIVRALGGVYAGAFTTTARDSIASGSRPYGLIITNTTTNELEWNQGSDASPSWVPIGGMRRYAADVGNGSDTQIDVTHNLGTRDVLVQIHEKASPYQVNDPVVELLDTNTVRLIFAVAPTSAQFRVVVIG